MVRTGGFELSVGSIAVLAALVGSAAPPALRLYENGYPGRLGRFIQVCCSCLEYFRSAGRGLSVIGRGVPGAAGFAAVSSAFSIRDMWSGGLFIRGGSLAKLSEALGISVDPPPLLYLADADLLVVLAFRNGVPVVVHACFDRDTLDKYEKGLALGRASLTAVGLGNLVPNVLAEHEVNGVRVLVSERLPGQRIYPERLGRTELLGYCTAALQPLRELAYGAEVVSGGADDAFLSRAERFVLRNDLAGHASAGALRAVSAWRGRWTRPAVVVHGDYCFANVLYQECGEMSVCGVIDWERARERGCYGFDAVYFIFFALALARRVSALAELSSFWRGSHDPLRDELICLVKREIGLSDIDVERLTLLVWLAILINQQGLVSSWSQARKRAMLDEPQESLRRWIDAGWTRTGQDEAK